MLNKEEIVKIIESDNDFRECGEYYTAFINNALDMTDECTYPWLLEEALASQEKEADHFARLVTTTITVVRDDGHHILVKEMMTDWNGHHLQWWLFDKGTLKGCLIWEDDDQ